MTLNPTTPPKYPLGASVMAVWLSDTVVVDFGYITGVVIAPDFAYGRGIWYSVTVTEGPDQGLKDWFEEGDLVPLFL